MDVGCYGLHALRMLGAALGGAPRVVGARAGERDPGVDAWLDASFALPGGVPATVRSGMNGSAFDFSYRLVGSRGQAFAPEFVRPHLGDRILVSGPDGERACERTGVTAPARSVRPSAARECGERVEELGTRSSYTYQLEALAAHLRDGAPVVTDADDAVATMELIDEVYRAAGLSPRPRHALPV